jgi:preprotein translocase subunit YajC
MLDMTTLLAQAQPPAEPKGAEKPGEPPASSPFLLLGLLAVMAYFMLIAPARKEKQKRQELLNALKKNDEVVTAGGIIGIVANIKDNADEVTLKSDETRLRVLRSSIVRIVSTKEEPKDQGIDTRIKAKE